MTPDELNALGLTLIIVGIAGLVLTLGALFADLNEPEDNVKRYLLFLLVLMLWPGSVWAQSANTVQTAIEDLAAQHVDLSGSCGAWRITNLVAWRLGYGLLNKGGGYRAVPNADGSACVDGAETRDAGYATDYIIEPSTFYGHDILSDAGGGNGAQWSDPETVFVERNISNFRHPLNPAGYMRGAQTTPVPQPQPLPSIDLTPVLNAIGQLTAQVTRLQTDLAAHDAREESHWQRAKDIYAQVAKYALPAIGAILGIKAAR